MIKTSVKGGAGKSATYNETFVLDDVRDRIMSGEDLIFESYDEDVVSDDYLASTKPVSYVDLIQSETETEHTFNFYEKRKKVGSLTISARYIFHPLKLAPPPVSNA